MGYQASYPQQHVLTKISKTYRQKAKKVRSDPSRVLESGPFLIVSGNPRRCRMFDPSRITAYDLKGPGLRT